MVGTKTVSSGTLCEKTLTWYGNTFDAGVGYVNDSVIGREDCKQYVSDSPTGGKWFSRFMKGAKLRMGVERRQNEALTPEIMRALDDIVETRWTASKNEKEREHLEEVMVYAICEYTAGLRGEEVPMLSLKGLLTYWDEAAGAKIPHIMLTLQGRFKGETNERWHCVPIVDVTGSGVQVRKWMQRLVIDRRYVKQRRWGGGWLFQRKDGTKGRICDYDGLFKNLIAEVKLKHPEVISKGIEPEDFSLWRSGRRGATTEATIKEVDTKVIELINRWRSKEAAKGAEPGLPMRQVYTAVKHTVPTMLQFSAAL